MNNRELGQYAEKLAANYLIAQGYEIIEANYFNKVGYRVGEIDIVAIDKEGGYVFVEVKARKGEKDKVVPEENITPVKIRRIEKAAYIFLRNKGSLEKNWRIDAVSVILDLKKRKAHLRHLKFIHN